ncbi:hypothetical protein [Nonomuraea rosea]|uniref:hypothetical protein n=1 Tax=Nonomuraea rosea TaxID=638574 RepID=UPI0031E7847E
METFIASSWRLSGVPASDYRERQAGFGVDHCTRLEQGRTTGVSDAALAWNPLTAAHPTTSA